MLREDSKIDPALEEPREGEEARRNGAGWFLGKGFPLSTYYACYYVSGARADVVPALSALNSSPL